MTSNTEPRHLGRYVPAAVVAVAAAVVTAHGLVEVATAARVSEPMAWAYPVITDGLALVAYRATSRLAGAAAGYAWTVVIGAAAMSGLAQAVFLAEDSLGVVPAQLRFAIGAWPAAAAAVAAHLLHLLWRGDQPAETAPSVEVAPSLTVEAVEATQSVASGELATGEQDVDEAPARPVEPPLDDRVAALVADLAAGEDVTGPQAAERFGCSERTARRLLGLARARLEAAAPRADPGARPTNPLHLVEGIGS